MIIYEPTDSPEETILDETLKVVELLDLDYNLCFQNETGMRFFYPAELLNILTEERVVFGANVPVELSDATFLWMSNLDPNAIMSLDD